MPSTLIHLSRLSRPATISILPSGTPSRCARNLISASLAWPSLGEAVSRIFRLLFSCTPTISFFWARVTTRTVKAAPRLASVILKLRFIVALSPCTDQFVPLTTTSNSQAAKQSAQHNQDEQRDDRTQVQAAHR